MKIFSESFHGSGTVRVVLSPPDEPVRQVMRKPKTVFAISKDGKLFVLLQAVMHPLRALCDGLPVAFFGRSKKAYLDIDTAIAWCEREQKCHSADKYATMIATMQRAKREHIAMERLREMIEEARCHAA
jgi:hypothetical protein